MTKDPLHQIQKDILGILKYTSEARFSDLNIHKLTNDHFTFHIKQLVSKNLIFKNSNGNYELTVEGKEFVSFIDFRRNRPEKRQKIIGLIILQENSIGTQRFLMHKRHRQPYFDYYGLPTIKISRGNKFEEYISAGLKEIIGLECNLNLIGLEHKMDYSQDHQLLEDNLFLIYKGDIVSGDLKEEVEEGINLWMTKEEISKQENVFGNVQVALKMLGEQGVVLQENEYVVEGF